MFFLSRAFIIYLQKNHAEISREKNCPASHELDERWIMPSVASLRLVQGDKRAEPLLKELLEILEANSLTKYNVEKKQISSVTIDHELTAIAGISLENSLQYYAGRRKIGETLSNRNQCAEYVQQWQIAQINNEKIFDNLIKMVGEDLPGGFERLKSKPPILAKKDDGWSCYESCSYCDGCGETMCQRCSGEGVLRCGTCDGEGELKCQYCFGHGYKLDEKNQRYICGVCFRGKIDCWSCSLTVAKKGHYPCDRCYGGGTNACNTCNETGILTFSFSAAISAKLGDVKAVCRSDWGASHERLVGDLVADPKRLLACSLASAEARTPVSKESIDQNKQKICLFEQRAPITIYIAEVQTDTLKEPIRVFKRAGETSHPWQNGGLDVILNDAVHQSMDLAPLSVLKIARSLRIGRYLITEAFGGPSNSPDVEAAKRELVMFSDDLMQVWREVLMGSYKKLPMRIVYSIWGWLILPLSALLAAYGYFGVVGVDITLDPGFSKNLSIIFDLLWILIMIFGVWKMVGFAALSKIREQIPEVQKIPPQGFTGGAMVLVAIMSAIIGFSMRFEFY
jgi:hypothetical protein